MANRIPGTKRSGELLASVDWHSAAADPSVYLPRPSTLAALSEIERVIAPRTSAKRARFSPTLLLGPSGVGKTLILRVLASRIRDRTTPVYLPFPSLPQSELCALTIGLVGGAITRFPESELLALALERRSLGRPLVLLVDDAGSMTRGAARGIAAISAVSHGGLRLVFAVTTGPEAHRLADAVGPDLAALPFMEPMSLLETGDYVRHRVARSMGVEAAARIDTSLLARIHLAAEGIPARVNALSSDARLGRPPQLPH